MHAGALPSGRILPCGLVVACHVLSWTLATSLLAAETATEPSSGSMPASSASVNAAPGTADSASAAPQLSSAANASPNDPLATTDELVKLPTVTVRRRPNDAAPADAWLSKKGRDDLAFKQNPGLRIGNLFRMNQGVASEMRREEQAAKKRDALKDEVERVSVGKSKADRKLRRQMQEAIARPNTEWLNGR